MNVRLKIAGLVTAVLTGLVNFSCSAELTANRPNILWITCEDSGRFLGCYGDASARTPNLDRLAKEGVRYTACYANGPVCSVARTSWILGMPTPTSGTTQMRSKYRVPRELVPYPTLLKQAGYYVTNNEKTDYNTSSFNKEIWDECSGTATYTNRAPGQPFFAVFNVLVSHEGQIFEKWYPKRKRYPEAKTPPDKIRIPPYQVKTPEIILDWQRMYDRLADMDAQVGQRLRDLENSGEADNTIVFYCSDHGGITLRTKRYLYDSGTRVPFIVYVPEKWRHLASGAPGSVSDRLVQFLDMPRTFLSLAGVQPPDRMTGRIFMGEHTEPAPKTVFLYADRFDEGPGISRAVTDGRWKYIRNFQPYRPRYLMIAYPLNQSGQFSQAMEYQAGRTDAIQSAIFEPLPPEELYDLQADPDEIHNLANDPANVDQLAQLRSQIDEKILSARDTGFIPEPMMASINCIRGKTIYDFAQGPERYPLPEILELAKVASNRDPADLPELRRNLTNPNVIFRYWAVSGLRALGKDAKPAVADLQRALEDKNSVVRIHAAVALAEFGQRDQSLAFLLKEARQAGTDAEALWALDGLRYLDAPKLLKDVPAKDVVRGSQSHIAYKALKRGLSTHHVPNSLNPKEK